MHTTNHHTLETSISVANFFIEKGLEEGTPVTPMQVIKLTYISYGWYIAYNDEELYDEDIQAWKFGPVINSLYHELKKYKNAAVTEKISEFDFSSFSTIRPTPSSDEVKHFLNQIWEAYKGYSAIDLSSITHMEGTPWYITWETGGAKHRDGVKIPTELIKKHYKAKLPE
jgi:uncharacterized phage-associated protein